MDGVEATLGADGLTRRLASNIPRIGNKEMPQRLTLRLKNDLSRRRRREEEEEDGTFEAFVEYKQPKGNSILAALQFSDPKSSMSN